MSKILRIAVTAGNLLIATSLACAQSQNPFQSVLDALKKTKDQIQQTAHGQSAPQQPGTNAAAHGATAAQQNSAPLSPDSTPSAQAVTAAAEKPDYGKLPNIGDTLHIGTSIEQIRTGMLQMHIGYKAAAGPAGIFTDLLGRDNQIAGVRATFLLDSGGFKRDQLFAVYTMPPGPQQVFAIGRDYPYPAPGIDKVMLVKALRDKYGTETSANYPGSQDHPMLGDQNILAMYWVYDEQGHELPADKSPVRVTGAAFGCNSLGIGLGGANVWVGAADSYRLNELPPAGFCDNVVVVSVYMGQGPMVQHTWTEIDDRALLRRAVISAGEAAKAGADRAQRQQIEQSKQAKPSL